MHIYLKHRKYITAQPKLFSVSVLGTIVLFSLLVSIQMYLASGQLTDRKSGNNSIKQGLGVIQYEAVEGISEEEQKHQIKKENKAIQSDDIVTEIPTDNDIPFKLPSFIPFP
jgi:uncharacterized membrane protein